MIDLVLSNNDVYIWNAEDWATLRKKHRIVGELVGCLPKHPRQETLKGLPMVLLSEEAKLLVEKGIARLIQYPSLEKEPIEDLKTVFLNYREKLYQEQKEISIELRKNQITSMIDKIMDGKKRKILGLGTSKKTSRKPLELETKQAIEEINFDEEALLQEELAKFPSLQKSDVYIQNHTVCPWLRESDVETLDWNYPQNEEQNLRYAVFKNLWESGFYITSGEKFGGDFVAYPGDPILFHSQLIVHCKDRNEKIPISRLLSQSRVGSHVRKTQVFGTWSEDKNSVVYQSMQWAESIIV